MNLSTNLLRDDRSKKWDLHLKKQDTLNDILYLIVNIVTFFRFYTGCTIDSPSPPSIVDILFKIADELSSADYRRYDKKYSQTITCILHTLVCHLLNTFSIFASNAKDPKFICILKIKDTIDAKPFDVIVYMSKQLLLQLQIVKITFTKGIIFVKPSSHLPLFFEDSSD